jgi:DNA-binding NarL/FixJ family response regulator
MLRSMSSTLIRVVIVDDQVVLRLGLRMVLDRAEGIEVVGEADDRESAVATVAACRPDVVLMDLGLPRLSGVEATRRIAADERLAGVRVAILTGVDGDDYLFEALRSGASGFLDKDADPSSVVDAVRVIAAGGSLLSPRATRRLIEEFTGWPERRPGVPDLVEELTHREREVLALVAYGLTNRQIAERLTVSPATAKTHVSRTMRKLGAHDRAQLVVIAHRCGLVSCGPRRLVAA